LKNFEGNSLKDYVGSGLRFGVNGKRTLTARPKVKRNFHTQLGKGEKKHKK
jgi:hypothetical protein